MLKVSKPIIKHNIIADVISVMIPILFIAMTAWSERMGCDLSTLFIRFILFSLSYAGLFITSLPRYLAIELKLHELGHKLGLVLIFKGIYNEHIEVYVNLIYDSSNKPSGLKTTSNKDDFIRNNKKYWIIRVYAASGLIFMSFLCFLLFWLSSIVCIFLKSAILGVTFCIISLEMFSLFNGRTTNDLNIFIHPDRF